MSACGIPPANALRLALTLVGQGEPLLRMDKRLHCAAAGIGVRLELGIRKDYEALGISLADTPAVLHGGRMLVRGLARTEELEALLRAIVETLPSRASPDPAAAVAPWTKGTA